MIVKKLVIAGTMILLLATACSSKQVETAASTEDVQSDNTKPVSLKVFVSDINLADNEFKELFVDPVHKKYPNYDIQLFRPDKNSTIEKLTASDEFPDLIFTPHTSLPNFTAFGIPMDLNPLIKRQKVDLSRFDQTALDEIKAFSDKGEMLALPLSINFSALFYNKDIFDKFGVSYPTDGMTWDDVIELAKKVSRKENGVSYYGLSPQSILHLASQLSLAFVDPKSDKATLASEGWMKVFQLYKTIHSIPGNPVPAAPNNAFLKDRTLAMHADYGAKVGQIEEMLANGESFNWDLTSYPVYKDLPGKGLGYQCQVLAVSVKSKHQQEAFQVISEMLSEQNQLAMTRNGRLSALKDPKFKQSFGENLQALKGKNVQGIFKTQLAPSPIPSPYKTLVQPFVQAALNKVMNGTADINTALRDAEDAANKAIATEKTK